MNKIAIVDDDVIICEKLKTLLKNHQYGVDVYYEGETFLPHGNEYELVILDVEIPDHNGIKIKNYLTKPFIIFISAYRDKILDAFGKNVVAYLDKHDELFDVRLLNFVSQYTEFPSLTIGDTVILLSHIIYLEGQGSYTCVHTHNGDFLFRKTLRDFQLLLNDHFMRIHKSYIVNLEEMTQLKVKQVVVGHVTLPVSQRYRETLKQAYLRYAYE